MDIKTYTNTIRDYDRQIAEITAAKNSFIQDNYTTVYNQWLAEIQEKKQAFLKLLPFILKNKEHFLNTTITYTVNAFRIYLYLGKPLGTSGISHNCITLKNLLKLWDMGFTYNGLPIVELKRFEGINDITYIENDEYKSVKNVSIPDNVLKRLREWSYKAEITDETGTDFTKIKSED